MQISSTMFQRIVKTDKAGTTFIVRMMAAVYESNKQP